ncbi:hypothetical protein L9F63_023239, partial [Diploptera punctata]
MLFLCIALILGNINLSTCQEETLIVNVTQGQLRGKVASTFRGLDYYSFQGIPYAKPPIAELRFKAPQPAESWEGVRDALEEGSVCPQLGVTANEDCLFVNVYTTYLPEKSSDELRPVLVWIHGGGYTTGSGNIEDQGPDYLLEEEIVLVTMNYRLGALGFLSTGDSVIPGNFGLKDQVMALRWIQENIAQFGGDPDKVTIFGMSAGGASIHYQVLSPLSKGLFHGAIAQSGSALNPWAFDETSTARNRTLRYAKALGITTEDSTELLEFFNSLSFQELLDGVAKTQTDLEKNHAIAFFVPTVEPKSDEAFLPDHPLSIMSEGTFNHVPFMTGTVSQEGMIRLDEVYNNPTATEYYDNNFDLILPENLLARIDSGTAKEIARTVKQLYFGDSKFSQQTLRQYVNFISDTQFLNGVSTHARMIGTSSTAPVYHYFFSFPGRLGNSLMNNGDYFPGITHGEEKGYLFYKTPSFDIEGTPEDLTLKRMIALWSNFVRKGNPTPEPDPLLQNVTWSPVTELDHFYLDIGGDLILKRDVDIDHMEFWNTLYNQHFYMDKTLPHRPILLLYARLKMWVAATVIVFVNVLNLCLCQDTVTVTVSQGQLRGRVAYTVNGATYFSFQGIPYAKPPVGELRFRPPQPAESWEGTKDALTWGPVCPQTGQNGSEDCLFINVFSTQLPENSSGNLKPVLVFIHGGGYLTGAGEFGPDYLLEQGDIVIAAMNYRLGALGFISLPGTEITSNNGLKDQNLALKWIQENIAQFGGDPNKVTIWGESAGATSVGMQMLSPMSTGLFHGVLADSGSVLTPWAVYVPGAGRSTAFQLGQLLGINTDDTSVLISTLRNATVEELVTATSSLS